MADIKTKVKSTIKTIDKALVQTEKFKNNIITAKEKINEYSSEEANQNPESFATTKVQGSINYSTRKGAEKFNEYGKKSVKDTKENIIKGKEKIAQIKSKMKKLFVMTLAAMALIGCQKADTNPFFNYKNWDTPHGTYPFEEIKTEHFMPAFEQAFAEGYAEIDSIVANPEAPTFENTIVALDEAGEMLNCVAGCFYNLTHSETNEQLQALEQELSPKMSEYSTSIILNEGLFARVKAVYEQRDQLTLTADQKELLQVLQVLYLPYI